jgi:Leucine-rich repeat (LRR) protein
LYAGLAALKHLRTLDCSDNPLKQLDGTQLPPGVEQATFTGCQIVALPRNLCALTNLQQLFLSANHLTDITPIWSCPALLHVGLSYNSVSAITAPPAVLQQCPIVSLDLAHNDITRVTSVAPSLSQLPKLQALGIKGNPLCLDPSKRAALLRCLPLLLYVDNQVSVGSLIKGWVRWVNGCKKEGKRLLKNSCRRRCAQANASREAGLSAGVVSCSSLLAIAAA